MSGLELQERLIERDITLPIIFITGHGDIPMAVRAMKFGAADFIQKPFREQELLDRVRELLAQDLSARKISWQKEHIKQRIDNLTPREHEIMRMIVDGKASKVIAIELELSQRTVETHRASIMQKMEAKSLAHLVQMVVQVGD